MCVSVICTWIVYFYYRILHLFRTWHWQIFYRTKWNSSLKNNIYKDNLFFQRYINDALNPEADFMKLYWHFERSEGSGLAGIFITSFLYLFTMFMTASIIYMYFLRYVDFLLSYFTILKVVDRLCVCSTTLYL